MVTFLKLSLCTLDNCMALLRRDAFKPQILNCRYVSGISVLMPVTYCLVTAKDLQAPLHQQLTQPSGKQLVSELVVTSP